MQAEITAGREGERAGEHDSLGRDHGWIETIFRDVVKQRPGRKWRVVTLIDGDILMRDSYALFALRDSLRDRTDIEYVHVRAWASILDDPLPPGVDVLFVGRPKPFAAASLAPLALRLEANMLGKFRDPSNGTTSNSIWYGHRRFRRHELEVSGDPEERRRCDIDFGFLTFRADPEADPERRVVAVGGLSALGTLGMMLILTDDERRRELLRQVRELAPWHEGMSPEEGVEITVRISVGGSDRLADLLNHLSFRFRVVAVAIAGGKEVVRDAAETEVELVADPDGKGGVVRLEGAGEACLTRDRFRLMTLLVEAGGQAPVAELCKSLGRHKGLVAKLVHDTNASVRKQIPSLEHVRLMRCSKKTGRYILAGGGTVR